jgi:hypothetical protein
VAIYAANNITIRGSAQVNVNTAQPSKLVIYAIGSSQAEVKENAQVYAQVLAPSRDTQLSGSAHLCGGLLGSTLTMLENAVFSMDAATVSDSSGAGGAAYTVTASWVENP